MRSLLLLLTAGAAWALATAAAAADFAAVKAQALERATSPDPGASVGAPTPGVSLTSSSGDTSAVLTFKIPWESSGDRLGAETLTVRFNVPLDKDSHEARFLSGGALVAGTSMELIFSGIVLPGHFREDAEAEKREYAAALGKCRADPANQGKPGSFCKSKTFNDMVEANYADSAALKDPNFDKASIWFWKVNGNVGTDTHKFRDPVTLKSASLDRTAYGVSASLSQISVIGSKSDRLLLGLGGEYKEDYQDAPKRNLCGPTTTAGVQECFNTSFAAPSSQRTSDAFAQLMWMPKPTKSLVGLKGLDAKLAYDFENQTVGVGASIYLFGDKEKVASAGVRLNWTSSGKDASSKDEFTAGFFVGVPLDLGA